MKKRFCLTSLLTALFLFTVFVFPCASAAPDVPAAASMIVYDVTDDTVLYGVNTDAIISPSSVSKLVTGAVSYRLLSDCPDETVTLTEELLKDAPKTKLKAGNQVTVRDLIRFTLCQRNNDAAYVLANYCCGSVNEFVAKMNLFAAEYGCQCTDFSNPAGLEYGTYFGQTTVRDLTTLINNVIKDESFLSFFDENSYVTGSISSVLLNKGMTDSVGYCRITLSEVKGHRLLCIVMGGTSEENAQTCTDTMAKWVYSSFNEVAVLSEGQTLCTIPVKNGAKTAEVNVAAGENVCVFTDDSESVQSTVRYEVHLFSEQVEAPVEKGTKVGSVTVLMNDTVVGNADAVAENDVEANSFSLAVYRFGLVLRERKITASVCMMIFLFFLYFFVIYRKNKKRQIMLQRYRNEHKDIYKR